MKALAPKWPRPGESLGLTAPAGAITPQELEAGLGALAELAPQLKIRVDEEVRGKTGYFSAEDKLRADHLNRLVADEGVNLIWAARGGFGTSRLLPLLDLSAMVESRKLFAGFSDITCLLNVLAHRGLICLHAPTLSQMPRLDEASRREVASVLGGRPPWPAELSGKPAQSGRASGPLMGGNLSLICHLVGTPYFPSLENAVLFLEDTNEAPYRLDRLVTQLELAGVLGRVAGFALGSFGLAETGFNRLAAEALTERLSPLGKPIVTDLPFGHGPENRCLPVGALAAMDGDRGILVVGADLG